MLAECIQILLYEVATLYSHIIIRLFCAIRIRTKFCDTNLWIFLKFIRFLFSMFLNKIQKLRSLKHHLCDSKNSQLYWFDEFILLYERIGSQKTVSEAAVQQVLS